MVVAIKKHYKKNVLILAFPIQIEFHMLFLSLKFPTCTLLLDCDIVLPGDPSISRKHAIVNISSFIKVGIYSEVLSHFHFHCIRHV